ncbi:MAG: methyltransferase domain-containing protein [Methanoregula sp.]|nr:methyltransferase domain-containing protein [Methanoregula sp.]
MTETFDPFWKYDEDACQYNEFTRATYARIYPVIADQILERTGITRGACLDVGSGPALLAIALALLSDLRVTALDSSPEMYELARRNIRDRCMEALVVPLIGDVHAIPAADAAFSLVVSRGSFHSWEDLPAAFLEISRVLRPGGMAYIGGGYGSARIRDEVLADRREREFVGDPMYPPRPRFPKFSVSEIEVSLEVAGISDYRIRIDDSGFWIIIRKNEEQKNRHGPALGKETGPENLPQFHDGFFFTQ